MKPYYLLGILALTALTMACDVVNPEEDIPAYVYIPDIELQTRNNTEGTASEKITDVWFNLDGNFLGAYPLPALIPILEINGQELALQAGIKDNGINSTPEIYPFYQTFTIPISLAPNEVDTIHPVISYQDAAQFAFVEDFERNAHLFENVVGNGNINQLELRTEGAFEGNQSLRIKLDTSGSIVELATTESFRGLTSQSPLVYLEVNYRSDVPVVFGVIGRTAGGAPVGALNPGFSPSEEWNKIYFNLTRILFDVNEEEYQVALQAFIPFEEGQLTLESAEVWLDNIKLVHF